jgi:hypothetical protein
MGSTVQWFAAPGQTDKIDRIAMSVLFLFRLDRGDVQAGNKRRPGLVVQTPKPSMCRLDLHLRFHQQSTLSAVARSTIHEVSVRQSHVTAAEQRLRLSVSFSIRSSR